MTLEQEKETQKVKRKECAGIAYATVDNEGTPASVAQRIAYATVDDDGTPATGKSVGFGGSRLENETAMARSDTQQNESK